MHGLQRGHLRSDGRPRQLQRVHGDVHRHLADAVGGVHGDDQPGLRVLGGLLERRRRTAGVLNLRGRHLRDGCVDLRLGEDLLGLYLGHGLLRFGRRRQLQHLLDVQRLADADERVHGVVQHSMRVLRWLLEQRCRAADLHAVRSRQVRGSVDLRRNVVLR